MIMNLLITGAWQQAAEYIKTIEEQGHNIVFLQYEKEELPCEYDWVEGVIGNGLFLYHSIEKFVNLQYIQLTSAGFDRVPMEYINQHGIKIHNARGVYSVPMAEFAIAGVLNIYKQMPFFYDHQKRHEWNKHRDLRDLCGKKICIVGCGSVGTECAKRFSAFGCDVTGVDLFPREDASYSQMVELNRLNEILPETDVLVLTLPLTEDTKHMMNAERFALLQEGAVLVNIARGAIIDSVALVDNVDKLGGAILDVFEEEPLDTNSPFWEMKNVIVTPHNSFVGDNNQKRLADLIITNLFAE